METHAAILILAGALASVTVLLVGWLWFMVRRPEKWAAFVDRENDFLVRLGVMSAGFAEKCKRLDKGIGWKLVAGGLAIIGIIQLIHVGVLLFRIYGHK